ncbi:MFS transporter [Tumebacillus avium]|uniref:MFS transporter n=1 Tax=Tumebacillus avium TaxID=1903704 RepID=UPI000B3B1725|nr:MFS transporter [Tumebacillus avium]
MKHRVILYLVAFAAFLGPFTQTIYTPILPEVQGHFATTQFLVNLSISIFTIVLAAMQIVYGPLTDRKGRRYVLLPGIFLYTLASIGCAFAPSIETLLIFRSLQAVGIAAGSVVATTVIGDLFSGKERGRAMGTFQMLVALGPVLGPVIGGFVGGSFGSRGVFFVLVATGLLMLVLNWRLLPETKPETGGGERFGLADFARILRDPTGHSVVLLGFVQYYTFYNFLVFLPDILTDTYGLTAEEKGIVFLPLSLSLVAGTYLGGRIQERIPPRKSLVLTAGLNVVSVLVFILAAHLSLWTLVVTLILFGICLGLSLPVQTTLLSERFVRERATAIGVYNFSRYMGMAAGPLLGSLLYQGSRLGVLFGFAALLFGAVVLFAGRQLKGTESTR